MFGVSFQELLFVGVVALLVLGPKKLPGVLRTVGTWIGKLRRLTTEVRQQSGIDDVLRAEGLHGGLSELRSIMRGGVNFPMPTAQYRPSGATARDREREAYNPDRSREYPVEGADSYGALPEDLIPSASKPSGVEPSHSSAHRAPESPEQSPEKAEPSS